MYDTFDMFYGIWYVLCWCQMQWTHIVAEEPQVVNKFLNKGLDVNHTIGSYLVLHTCWRETMMNKIDNYTNLEMQSLKSESCHDTNFVVAAGTGVLLWQFTVPLVTPVFQW